MKCKRCGLPIDEGKLGCEECAMHSSEKEILRRLCGSDAELEKPLKVFLIPHRLLDRRYVKHISVEQRSPVLCRTEVIARNKAEGVNLNELAKKLGPLGEVCTNCQERFNAICEAIATP